MADGTVKSVVIDSDDTDQAIKDANLTLDPDATKAADQKLTAVTKAFKEHIVSYSENSDGTYSLTAEAALNPYTGEKDATKNGSARIQLQSGTKYADKNTVFLVNDDVNDPDDFDAYVGYNNVPDIKTANGSSIAVYEKNGVAKFVVLNKVDVEGSSNDVIFVVGDSNPTTYKTGSTKYYSYDAVVNGEVTSIKVKYGSTAATTLSSVKDDQVGVFFGLNKNSDGYVDKLTEKSPTDVEVNGAQSKDSSKTSTYASVITTATKLSGQDIVYTGTKRESNGGNIGFVYDPSTKEYTKSFAANDKALIVYYDGKDLSIAKRVNTDTDDQALVITDDGDVIAVLVLEMENGSLSHG